MSSSNATAVMDPQYGGSIPLMWIPCVVFAHLFACSFLLSMLKVAHPAAWETAKRRLLCRGRRTSSHAAGSAEATSTAAASTPVKRSRLKSHAAYAAAVPPVGAKALPAAAAAAGTSARDVCPVDQNGRPEYDCELGAVTAGARQDASSTTSSHKSVDLINKLAPLVKPMLLEWEQISCIYNTAKGSKNVLTNVWGRADPGDMVAIMGPSGAGKSTLMDILAGRKSVGELRGVVLVNKQRQRKEHFRKRTAYVPQEDNFLPTMTVQETLTFYATLQLPDSNTKGQRLERVAEVLAAMGLSHTVNTLVGGSLPGGIILRGLSGGERKRLSIAQGIMSTPCIVFLDEPTSGLDSFAALNVMAYMRGMATKFSQTVISSIHQPRAAIWQLFDRVVLLSSGYMMFSGDREGLVPWFAEGCGYPYDPAMHGLASDWVMDLVNVGFTKPESLFGRMMATHDELESAAAAFLDKYLLDNSVYSSKTDIAAHAASAKDQGHDDKGHEHDIEAGTTGSTAAAAELSGQQQQQRKSWLGRHDDKEVAKTAGWFKQCRVLLWRELLSVTRNPADVAGRCLIFTWLAVFVGLIFYNLPTTVDSLRSRMNVLFVEPVILLLMPYVYMSLFTSDKQYFIQDVSAKLYSPSAYYVAKQLAVLPFAVLNSLLFAFTLYGLAGLRHNLVSVGQNGLMSVMIYLIAAQVLTFTAVVMPNQDLAFMGAIAWTAINLLMSNFMVRYQDIDQRWFSQLRYLSAMGYAFDGYGQAEFAGVSYSCAGGIAPTITGFLPKFLPNTPIIRSPAALNQLANPGVGCVIHLDQILGYFGLFRPFWMTCVILLGYLGVLHVMTFIGQLQLTRKERR